MAFARPHSSARCQSHENMRRSTSSVSKKSPESAHLRRGAQIDSSSVHGRLGLGGGGFARGGSRFA